VATLCASFVVSSLDASEPEQAPVAVAPTTSPTPSVSSSPFSARHTAGRASLPAPAAEPDPPAAPAAPAPDPTPRTGPVVVTVPGPRSDGRPALVVPGDLGYADASDSETEPKHVEARPAPPAPPSGPTLPPPAPSPTPVPDEGDSSAPTPTTPTPSATPEDDEETGDAGDAGDDERAGSAVAPRSEERRVGQERQGSEAASAVKE